MDSPFARPCHFKSKVPPLGSSPNQAGHILEQCKATSLYIMIKTLSVVMTSVHVSL